MSANGSENRPNLLFLTPTLPCTTGTGSAIRAGVTVASLARHFNVYVLHAELWGWHKQSFKTDFVRQHAARYVYYIPQAGELPMPQIMREHFRDVRFQAIHSFRLVIARAAVSALMLCESPRPFSVVDLDDDEPDRAERFLELREKAGESQRAQLERRGLPQLRVLERMLMPHFQAICLAARADCDRLSQRYAGAKLVHLPNAVFLPAATPLRSSGRVPTLLFVGTLDYLPNEDGVNYFCTHVLPALRQKYAHPIRVRLVGANPRPCVTGLSRHPEVEVLANVPDVAQYYADADVVIVPLRAGSGTRIKILEAFSFRKPVVSTTIGAAGLTVTDGRQLLIADEPEAFANACARLIADPVLSANVAESAWEWLLANHSVDRVDEVLRSLYEPMLGTERQ